jgi:hypothetical protein
MAFFNKHIKTKFEKTIGTGTILQEEYPVYFYYEYGYFAHIYTKEELGIGAPIWITGVRFDIVGDSVQDEAMTNQTLKLGQVNSNEFATNVRNNMIQNPSAGWVCSNLTTVKSNFTFSVPEDYNGWIEIDFDTHFQFNPLSSESNLLLLWENRHDDYFSYSTRPASKSSTSNGLFRSYYDYQDITMPPETDAGTRDSTGRPNIQLIFEV